MGRTSLVLLALAGACAPEFDPDRVGVDPGTFGERVVTLLCKRLAYQADPTDVSGDRYRDTCRGGAVPAGAPPAIAALAANRARVVHAIDHVVPPDQTAALQTYLTSAEVLGMYDDDTMSTTLASVADMLDEMGNDPEAMAALERLGQREGYRDPAHAIGPAGPMTSSPHIRPLLDQVLPTLVEGGSANAEWNALVAALSATFLDASVPPDAGTADSTAVIVNRLLMTERADLGEATPLVMVRRDHRGIAKVALVGGELPAPFFDSDGDKLADIDAAGRYIDAAGTPLAIATPFETRGDFAMRDDQGRALDPGGAPIYEYFDATKTLMGAMGDDTPILLDPVNGTGMDLVRGASLLLGERAPQTKTFENGATLTYPGYDTQDSPLLDMAYAYAQLLRDPNTRDVLALTDELFGNHPATTARITEAAVASFRMGDAHPEAAIPASSAFWDDMLPLIRQITADPQLVRDLMAAMARPETRQVIDRFREFMTFSDRFDIDPNTQAVTGALTKQPDRTQADSGLNRSLWARLLHIISDSNGAVQCNKPNATLKLNGITLATYAECEFFRIPNMAVFYLQSIAFAKDAQGRIICEGNAGEFGATQAATTPEGCAAFGAGFRPRPKANFNYDWNQGLVNEALIQLQGGDQFVEDNATIVGMRSHPTPQALNRVLFLEPTPPALADTTDPATDKFGAVVRVKHPGTLPVWEKNNFYNQIRPIIQAFADANQEKTFVDIMSALHRHWSSTQSTSTQHTIPNGPNFTVGSNLGSYEPLVIEVFQGDLWPALTESAAELNAITVNGKSYATVLGNSGRFLVSPLPGLTDRRGNATTTTADGKPVTTLSPWHVLADAYVRKRTRLAAAGADAELWNATITELVDMLMRADNAGGTRSFRNKHFAASTLGIVDLIRGRLASHDAAGDRIEWLSTILPGKIEEFFTHPVFAGVADFIAAQTAGGGRTVLEQLLHDLFDPAAFPDAYATMRIGGADLAMLSLDDADLVPLAHMAGRLLAPDKPYLPLQLAFLRKLHAADTSSTFSDLVARLFAPHDTTAEPGIPALSAIVDGVGDVDRVTPGPTPAAWSRDDYGSIFKTIAAFMREQQRGLPRFIAIVKGRDP